MVTREQLIQMRERITDEIFYALGLKKNGLPRKLLGWLFYLPTSRFTRMFAAADEAADLGGLPAACQVVIDSLAVTVHASGTEHLSSDGPLMILSNHPGAYDSVAIGSLVPRTDFRIIVYEIPFYRALPRIGPRLIYAPVETTGRMVALRTAIDHLQNGGSLLQFGAGTIEPDPAVQPGAVDYLARWSASAEIMLRKAPETRVVLAVASGVLLKRFFTHPLIRLRRQPVAKRRLAEFLQVLQQLVSPKSVKAEMRLRFAPPVSGHELIQQANGGRLMPILIQHAHRLLAEHALSDNLLL